MQSGGLGRAVVSDRHALPGADRKLGRRLDRDRAVGPEVDHTPAKFTVIDQKFDARGIAITGVETSGVEHRGAGVLLAETKEGRERERIEAAELLEFRKDEAGITIEFHRLAFDAGNKLKVFGGAPTLELGRLAACNTVVDAGLRERFEREMGGWGGDGNLDVGGDGPNRGDRLLR